MITACPLGPPHAEVFRVIDAETGEQVGKPVWDVFRYWPSPDGARLIAVTDGRSAPGRRSADGRARRRVLAGPGVPDWVSIAPDGDRIAVTHWSDGTASDLLDGTGAIEEGTWLAIVSADDHRVLLDEPPRPSVAHVLLDDGDLIALEASHASLRDRPPRSDRHRPRCGRHPREPIAERGRAGPPRDGRRRNRPVLRRSDGSSIGEPFRTDAETLAPACSVPTGSSWRCRRPTA